MPSQTTESVRSTESLGTAPIGRLILRFAAPGVVSMLVMSLYNIVDQFFIGRGVGYLGNAATNVVFPVNVLAIAVSMLIGEGTVTMYSIRMGEGNGEEARTCVGNAVILLSVIGVVFATICLLFLQPVLGFFGATETVMPYAVDYAAPIVFGIPFVVVGPGLNVFIRAKGRPGYAMMSMVVGAVLNTILDPIFIFTFGMGVKGAAIATAISQFASFAFTVAFYLRGNGFGLARRHFRLAGRVVRRILACGLPPAASQMAIMVVIVTLNRALVECGAASRFGSDIPLAAHGVTMKVNQILFSILLGIAIGTQPIIGFNFGARRYDRVKKTFKTALVVTTLVGTAGFVAFVFFPARIVALFGAENALYNEFAVKCFRIFLFFSALNGFTVLSGTFFQSMAKVSRAALIQLSRQVLLMIPAVYILSRLFGLEGILYAGPVTDGLTFCLALFLVVREMRHLDRLQAERAL